MNAKNDATENSYNQIQSEIIREGQVIRVIHDTTSNRKPLKSLIKRKKDSESVKEESGASITYYKGKPVLGKWYSVSTKEVKFAKDKKLVEIKEFKPEETEIYYCQINNEMINECDSLKTLIIIQKILEKNIENFLRSETTPEEKKDAIYKELMIMYDMLPDAKNRITGKTKSAIEKQEMLNNEMSKVEQNCKHLVENKDKKQALNDSRKSTEKKETGNYSENESPVSKSVDELIYDHVFMRHVDLCILLNYQMKDANKDSETRRLFEMVKNAVARIGNLRICLWLRCKDLNKIRSYWVTDFITTQTNLEEIIPAQIYGSLLNDIWNIKWEPNSLRLLWCINEKHHVDVFNKEFKNENIKSLFDSLQIQLSYFVMDSKFNLARTESYHKISDLKDILEPTTTNGFDINKIIQSEKALHVRRELFNLTRYSINSEKDFSNYLRAQKSGFKNEIIMKIDYFNSHPHFPLNKNEAFCSKLYACSHQISVFEFKFLFTFSDKKIWGHAFENEIIANNFIAIFDKAKEYIAFFNTAQTFVRLTFGEEITVKQMEHFHMLFNNRDVSIQHAEIGDYSDTDEVLQAFTHFTYHRSNKECIVIPTIAKPKLKKKSEPCSSHSSNNCSCRFENIQIYECAVFSAGKKYGASDLGLRGIRRFLENHKCDQLCQSLNKSRYETEI